MTSFLTSLLLQSKCFRNIRIITRLQTSIVKSLSTTTTMASTTISRTPPNKPQSEHARVFPTPLQSNPDPKYATFDTLGIHPSVKDALVKTGKIHPTEIQARSIPSVLSNHHVLIASETGSGKTLAYLIPLISRIKTLEMTHQRDHNNNDDDDMIIGPRDMSPSILILQPTRELVMQAVHVAKELSHIAKFRVRGIMGGTKRSLQESILKRRGPVDILVSTPGAIQRLMELKKIHLSTVKTVVFDEADELLEAQHHRLEQKPSKYKEEQDREKIQKMTFSQQLTPILKALSSSNDVVKIHTSNGDDNVQFIYVAATVPARMDQWLRQRHGHGVDSKLRVIRTSKLHTATAMGLPNPTDVHQRGPLKTTFIRVSGNEDGTDEAKLYKMNEILTMAIARGSMTGKVLIFCDSSDRREMIINRLRMSIDKKKTKLFHLGNGDNENREKNWEKFRKSNPNENCIAVCPRSFARGIDDWGIRTIILFDVPLTGAEYVHRIGRLRNGGRIYTLIGPKERARAETLFLKHVKGERIAGVDPTSAWNDFVHAGRDRIETTTAVRRARKNDMARWVDERASKIGTFRGKKGRGVSRLEQKQQLKHVQITDGRAIVRESLRGVVAGKMKPRKKPKKKRY